ncbi:hypothetical protein OSB04_010592 [Centaurea solstitialis]|uniref:FACT complex subunit n=1 Tax=Centaurea solstitialis TaxID=347529 RepID=A0AA38TFH2_9ASTR|nr:hypothetical protein OSB04_010592 [Centaurea solstitialis]
MADHQTHPSMGAGGYTIDAATLVRRLQSLYSHWREHRDELWGSSSAFAVATPPPSDDLRYLKSSALNIWLLGYEFPETIMVFSDKQMHILSSQKKVSMLEVVKKSAKEAVDLFAVKEACELTSVIEAAYLTASAMKLFVVPKLEKVIDKEKKVTHSSLMNETKKAILEPARIKVKLKADDVDICYPPIFQSGGNFDIRRFKTFLMDSNATQSKAYQPGNKASTVYKAAYAAVEKEASELISNLTKSAGTGTGLEFRESGMSLSEKNDRVLKAGMVFKRFAWVSEHAEKE